MISAQSRTPLKKKNGIERATFLFDKHDLLSQDLQNFVGMSSSSSTKIWKNNLSGLIERWNFQVTKLIFRFSPRMGFHLIEIISLFSILQYRTQPLGCPNPSICVLLVAARVRECTPSYFVPREGITSRVRSKPNLRLKSHCCSRQKKKLLSKFLNQNK